MFDIGGPELLIVLAVFLVVFGGSQIPKLARNLGKAQEEFRRGIAEGAGEDPAGEPAPDCPAAD